MSEREFELGDVLSITTGRLVSNRLIAGVYDILNFMTGDDLFTHQLPRAGEACAPILLEQHPELANVIVPKKFEDEAHVNRWRTEQEIVYGKTLTVSQLADGQHRHIDPIEEMADMVGHEKLLVFDPENPEQSLGEIVDIITKP